MNPDDATTLASVTEAPISQDDASAEPQEILIRPRKGWIAIDWAELVQYRELLFFLVWRDVKARYKQTVLGATWAILTPVFTMIVFTLIFGKLAKVPSDGLPYAVFVYAGILPWTFFSVGVTHAASSLIGSRNLLTKVYFPRLLLPAAATAHGLVDLGISFGVYGGILAIYGVTPSWGAVFVPFLVLLTAMAALGVGCIFAALNVTYRDFGAIADFSIRILMYLSPVVYSVSLVPRKYHALLSVNPMAGIIDAHRSAILGTPWNLATLAISTLVTLALFIFGIYFFRRTERRFADVA